MNFAGMNILAIGLAAVAGFAFGAVYYMSLSRQWLAAIGKTKEEISGKRSIAPFITSVVALVVMVAALLVQAAVAKRLGGLTGDVYGLGIELAEAAALVAGCAIVRLAG